MELYFKKKNKTIIIQISGEIDHHSAAGIRNHTESALLELGGKNIIYDFQKVTFMDSSGIGMLIGRYKQLETIGGRIAIVNINDTIAEMFHLSGLKVIIPVFDSTEAAVNYTEGRDKDAF